MNILEFCKKLPKVELHAHLNGSLSQDTLIALGVPEESLKSYQINNYEATKENLSDCFKLFKIAQAATSTREAVYIATKRTISDFHRDNVMYLELRTTPREEPNMTKKEYIEAVVRGIRNNEDPIIVKLILSIDRRHQAQVSKDGLDLIIALHNRYPNVIKGIDLSGDPTQGNFDEDLFVKARENGLKITLHCGEVKNDAEVTKMLNFKPERIGHATCVHADYGGCKEVWELYKKVQLPLECCLTSNVLCATSKSYQEHHIKEWLKKDLPFCLNTDDKGVFNTSLSEEYLHAAENLNLSKESLFNCSLKAIDYSFAAPEEQVHLKSFLLNWQEENRNLFN